MKLHAPATLGRTLTFALLAATMLWVRPAGAQDQQPPSRVVTAQQLAERSVHGDFDGVLSVLQARADQSNPDVVALTSDVRRYQQHVADAEADRRQAYTEALGEVVKHFDEVKIEDALIAAIDAHSLAADKEALLTNPTVIRVVVEAKRRAGAAETEGDWVEALNLYRELDLLFEDQGTYRETARRVAKHVRVLQLYAPTKLQELYRAYAAQRGDEQPPQVEPESWRQKLEGIELPMLRQALAQSARRHVSNDGYLPLMRGAVRSLNIMLHTDALADEFPAFADPDKLTVFQDYLDRLAAQLEEPGKRLNYLDTWSIIERIGNTNRDTLNLPEQVIVYELTEGATETLDDFSAVIWPQDRQAFARSTQGKFIGVGIQIRRNTKLTVVSPLPNTPAQKAGVKAGDIIATVDGKSTDTWGIDRAVREITGEAGTTVTLGIQRSGVEDLLEVPIKREEIPIESILGWQRTDDGQWDFWLDKSAGIGYVRLTQFLPQTAADLDAAVAQLTDDRNFHGLILDLRFNPGGLLGSAIDVADRFIADGTIVSTVSADGKTNDQTKAQRRVTYPRFPVVVLINQGSASASEIVSGALQDYGRAYIVGMRSYGKGSVQDLFPLDHGDAYLKLTTQYYMLPRGRIIHRKPDAAEWGIDPDLRIEMTDRQVADALQLRQDLDVIRDAPPAEGEDQPATADALIDDGVDLQLEAAMLLLKTQFLADNIALARSE